MMTDRKIGNKNSLFKETIVTLREITYNHIPKYPLKVKSANTYNVKNNFESVGLKLTNHSILLKKQKTAKPVKLPIAGS